jgi:hypothetical protein
VDHIIQSFAVWWKLKLAIVFMLLIAELTLVSVVKEHALMHLLIVKNRQLVVLMLAFFIVIIWVLSLKNALVLYVKHSLL